MGDYRITTATEADIPDLLRLILDLAIYEKEPDAVKATPELMLENVFKRKYAEVFIARVDGGEEDGKAVGMALYFYTYSTWLGQPGIYVSCEDLRPSKLSSGWVPYIADVEQLEDLFVDEKHRGRGLGKRLFGELGRLAQEKKCGRVEWRVLKASPSSRLNHPPLARPHLSFRLDTVGCDLGHPPNPALTPRMHWQLINQWNKPSIDFYEQCLKAEPQSEWEGMRIEGEEGIARLAAMRRE